MFQEFLKNILGCKGQLSHRDELVALRQIDPTSHQANITGISFAAYLQPGDVLTRQMPQSGSGNRFVTLTIPIRE